MGRLAGWAAPLLRPGGQLLALKGAGAVAEMATGWPAIREARMEVGATLFVISVALEGSGAEWLPAVQVVEQARWRAKSQPEAMMVAANDVLVEDGEAGETKEALAVVVRLNRGAPGLSQRRSSGLG